MSHVDFEFLPDQKQWFTKEADSHEFEVRINVPSRRDVTEEIFNNVLGTFKHDTSYRVSEKEYTNVSYDRKDLVEITNTKERERIRTMELHQILSSETDRILKETQSSLEAEIKRIGKGYMPVFGKREYRQEIIHHYTVDGVPQPITDRYMSKTKVCAIDKNKKEITRNIDFLGFMVRVSEAKEENEVSLPANTVESFRRNMNRTSFSKDGPGGRVVFDFSVVVNTNSQGVVKTYEIELEFMPLDRTLFFEEMRPYLFMLLNCVVTPTLPPISSVVFFQKSTLERRMGELEERMGHEFNRDLRGLAFNIKRHHFEHMAKYALTNKLDGERKMVYVTPDYIYILHPHGVSPNGARNDIFLAVPVPPQPEPLPCMMLDCEYANGMLYMFDVLYHEMYFRPVDKVYHRQRMASVTHSLDHLIPFTKKHFYYGHSMEEKLHAFMTEHSDPHLFFKQNDGFILTYTECSYVDTNKRFPHLKYKFTSKLSTDFFIHKINIEDPLFNHCYQLFSDPKHLERWTKHYKRITKCTSTELERIRVNFIPKKDDYQSKSTYNDLVYGFYLRVSHPSCPISKNEVFSTTDLRRFRVILSKWSDFSGILRTMDDSKLNMFMDQLTELHKDHPYRILKRIEPLVDHSIIECLFAKNTFLFHRSRPDRVVGNRYDIVQDNNIDMENPISLTEMFPIPHEWWKTYLFKLEEDNKSFVLGESKDTTLSTAYHFLPNMIQTVMSCLHLTEPYKYLYPPEPAAIAQRQSNVAQQVQLFHNDFIGIIKKRGHVTNFQWLWEMVKQWTLRMPKDMYVNVYTMNELSEFEKISPLTVDKPWFDVRRFDVYKNNHVCVAKHGYATPIVRHALPPLNRDVRLYSFSESITSDDSKYTLFKNIGETYSSLKPWEQRQIKRIFREWFRYPDDVKTIVDATAHIGMDTMNWANLFQSSHVHAFEINSVAYVALEHNINVSGLTGRVTPHYSDCTEWMPTEPIDIVYLDPPWGGPNYKDEKCLELYVQKELQKQETPQPSKNVNCIIDRWMATDLVKTIVLKAPSNFNQSYLYRRYKVDTEIVLNKHESDISYYVLRITKTESILYKPFSQLTLWTIPYITESYEPLFHNTNMVLVKMPGDVIMDTLHMNVSYFLYTPFSYQAPRLITYDELTDCAQKMGFVYKKGVIIDKMAYVLFVKEGVTEDDSDTLKEVKQYHNVEKRALITQFCKKKIVLDLGAGFGGDLLKYNEINVRHLFLVEPNERNILQLKTRITSMVKLDKKSTLILAKGQDADMITKKIAPHRMEVVSSFFSLTFLFESDAILSTFLDTVSASVTEGGYFIGTMMSGEKTYDLLNGKPNGSSTVLVTNKTNGNELVTLHKEYEDLKKDEVPRTGMKLRIGISDSIVGENQTEYLAFFSVLSRELEKRHFKRVEYIEFKPPVDKVIHEDERVFSALNIGFAFRYLPSVIPYATLPSPIDQTFEYNNLYKESQILVRTGVPRELSFYHAYLFNTSVSYRDASPSDRKQAALDLSKQHPNVTLDTLPAFIKSVDTNIYVIDSKTRRPINLDTILPDGTKQKTYKVMRDWSIILTIIGTHFEPVAVNKEGTAIRKFEKYEPVLAKIHHEMRKSESQ